MYIIDDPTIIIQRNDHNSLEVRGRYISDDPTIRLHFARLKKIEKDSEKREDRGKELKKLHVSPDTCLS